MFDGKANILYGSGLVKLVNESFIKKIAITFTIDGDYDINDRGGIAYYFRRSGRTYTAIIRAVDKNKILDGTIIRYTGSINILSAKINNVYKLTPYNLAYKDTTLESVTGMIQRLEDSIDNVGELLSMGDSSKIIADNKLTVYSNKRWPMYRKNNMFKKLREISLVSGNQDVDLSSPDKPIIRDSKVISSQIKKTHKLPKRRGQKGPAKKSKRRKVMQRKFTGKGKGKY